MTARSIAINENAATIGAMQSSYFPASCSSHEVKLLSIPLRFQESKLLLI